MAVTNCIMHMHVMCLCIGRERHVELQNNIQRMYACVYVCMCVYVHAYMQLHINSLHQRAGMKIAVSHLTFPPRIKACVARRNVRTEKGGSIPRHCCYVRGQMML